MAQLSWDLPNTMADFFCTKESTETLRLPAVEPPGTPVNHILLPTSDVFAILPLELCLLE